MEGAAVRKRAAELPREPGVYQFLEHAPGTAENDVVIYVGKAVDLRDRVRSYADPRSDRISRMLHRASAIDFAVTDTETQALLLEANLIKRHQPRYNVRLKDDKSYPMIELTGHEFPRIEITRDPDAGATVFGPFTDKGHLEEVVHAVRSVYGIRQCPDGRFYTRDRPCLDYQIGLCSGSCGEKISAEEYAEDVDRVAKFFEGETGVLADPLREGMEEAAAEADFERAANFRDRLEAVEALHGSGGAAVDAREDPEDARAIDVLGASLEGDRATVARLHAEAGKLIDRDRHTLSIPDADAEDDTEPATAAGSVADGGTPAAAETQPGDRLARVLGSFVQQYYADRTLPDRLLLSERLADPDIEAWLENEGVSLSVPGAGREATLVDLALKNARRSHDTDEAGALRDSLSLSNRPTRIEGFDVSHAQGRDVVGSDVVFVDGTPEKSEYRRKKLGETNDDYANMRDLLRWRAQRAVEGRDDRPDPDLLLIDGGEGQLDAAREALEECGWEIPAIALAKDEEIVVMPAGTHDWASDAPQLHLCQRVRDEAHRFAVQYHETLRDDVSTVLEEVSGVGPELRTRLLRRFGSVDGVREASLEELRGVSGVGERTAETLGSRL